MATTERTATTTSTITLAPLQRRTMSASEARISLIFALASQASSVSQRLFMDSASESAKYVFPRRFQSRNLEEALMVENQDKWQMSFVMPSKYGSVLPLPKDPSVRIKEVPRNAVAVVAFSGFVTDEEVKQGELELQEALRK